MYDSSSVLRCRREEIVTAESNEPIAVVRVMK